MTLSDEFAWFRPEHAADWTFAPDFEKVGQHAAAWRRRHAGARPPTQTAHLLVIDAQRDFCLPGGSLFVAGRSGRGAVDDSVRLCQFIYRNLAALTGMTFTYDAHLALQIFFPAFWRDADGEVPAAHQAVTSDAIARGVLRPAPGLGAALGLGGDDALLTEVRHYCETLEASGRYGLYLWPTHCLKGSLGATLAGVIDEARIFYALARQVQIANIDKGDLALTESYSVFGPEVASGSARVPYPHQRDQIAKLLSNDVLYVAGQAQSHCVRSSLDDLAAFIANHDPSLARRVHILTDCMSAVAVANGQGGFVVDYTDETRAAYARFEAMGMRLVTSGTCIS